jgi:hypothetical protein
LASVALVGRDLGVRGAHHVGDEPRHRDLEDVERLQSCLELVAGVAHARLVAQQGVVCGGDARARHVAAGVELERVALDAMLVCGDGR